MMQERDDGAWFAPKRFGYGAGLPIAWQGWAVLVAYLAVLLAVRHWQPRGGWLVMLTATLVLVWIAAVKTRGGWHWRWRGAR
jgi:uncharacterized membrane protein YjgN (DUF898 family)